MNVNEKGSIGLIEVVRDLTRKGHECFLPIHDYSAVDCIAMRSDRTLSRLQVKYREFRKGIIDIPFHTMVNGKRCPIDMSAIDAWAIYIPSKDAICYISKCMVGETLKGFRLRETIGAKTINIDKIQVPLYSDVLCERVIWKGGREA